MDYNKLIKGKTGNLFIQFVRYFISGGIAFVVDFSLLYLLTEICSVHYVLSSVISFTVGLIITYIFSVTWIFDKRSIKNRRAEFLIFAVIGGVGLLLTSFFMWFFTDILDFHYLISKAFTTVIVFCWNFAAKRFILFSEKTR